VDDLRAQLRDAEADVNLDVVRIPISRFEDVVRALRQAADAQFVVLTRGGQGVQELDTDELIGAVAAAAVPVAVALGHATDDLVLNRVADVSFPTPTALGAWLRSVVDEKRDRARQAAEAEAVERAGGPLQGGTVPVGGDSAGEELDRRLDAVGRRVAGAVREYLRGVILADLAVGKMVRR
jgi:hypothetical protein